jgi:hypothetical protein
VTGKYQSTFGYRHRLTVLRNESSAHKSNPTADLHFCVRCFNSG